MIEGRLIRLSDLQPTCLPGLKDTNSYEIISRNTVGAKHIEFLLKVYSVGIHCRQWRNSYRPLAQITRVHHSAYRFILENKFRCVIHLIHLID